MAEKIFGYNGKLLRANLTEKKITVETLDEAILRKYIGGTALGTRILYDEVPASANYNDPENRIIFASGPLGASRMGGSGTYSIVTVGALTNGATSTQANGYFGAYLRLSGFDALVVEGASKDWIYLYIHEGQAEIRDAKSLLGLDSFETEDAIKKELDLPDHRSSVASIGPAGENGVRFAVVNSDHGHIASHNGPGTVMGSKRLKAIAISRMMGKAPVFKDTEKMAAIGKELIELLKTNKFCGDIYHQGTLGGVATANRIMLPVKNYATLVWDIDKEKLARWTSDAMRARYPGKRKSCFGCQMRHCYEMEISEGPYAPKLVEEPEYECMAAFGPVIDNKDEVAALLLNDDNDRLGMDANEMGWVLGFVMECYEKGILTKERLDGLEMKWGNVEATRTLVKKIAHREGIGNILADGVMRAAKSIGGEAINMAIHTAKGNTPRGHDHRVGWHELFDTCVSSAGCFEVSLWGHHALLDIGVKPPPNPLGFGYPKEVAALVAKTKGAQVFDDSLGMCRFNSMTKLPDICQAINAATGWDFSKEEALQIGLRGVHLMKMFNVRRGIAGRDLDRPSPRYGSTPTDGFAKGVSSAAVWDQMLDIYYDSMGWDKKAGNPLPQTLEKLGLGDLVKDLP